MNTKVAISRIWVLERMGYFQHLVESKDANVVSICGKNSERMLNYCKKLSLNRYTDWRKMLQKEKPDAVAIAVIPSHQYEIAKTCLGKWSGGFCRETSDNIF